MFSDNNSGNGAHCDNTYNICRDNDTGRVSSKEKKMQKLRLLTQYKDLMISI
jgi:hypothetical protein